VSVGAAAALVALKLSVGLAANSLGLVSEAVHSGTDLVAALLTFFALGVSGRPADRSHPYGHGKAEHLAALAEASFLAVVSVLIAVRALERLFGSTTPTVHTPWYVFATMGVVILVDLSRASVSWRVSRQTGSPAVASNALHFSSDLAGSVAVLVGLVLASQGYPGGDAVAALFVAVLVLLAAARLIRGNVDVLMDRAPTAADRVAREAIVALGPEVELRRLRMRQAAGRQFADVVIGVSSSSPVGQGHAAADAVEAAVQQALPGSDVVVHVEPGKESDPRERAHAAAAAVPGVREIHNVSLVDVGGRKELSLHVKLPGEMTLAEAHDVAEHVEQAIRSAVPSLDGVRTHLEPLTGQSEGEEVAGNSAAVERIVREVTGSPPRELRFVRTDAGLVAYLTLGLDGATSLDAAHSCASEIEALVRTSAPEIAEVAIHTEPAAERPVRRRRTGGEGPGEPGGSPGSGAST
jgi:cation diffusion facilitator family transporter